MTARDVEAKKKLALSAIEAITDSSFYVAAEAALVSILTHADGGLHYLKYQQGHKPSRKKKR